MPYVKQPVRLICINRRKVINFRTERALLKYAEKHGLIVRRSNLDVSAFYVEGRKDRV